MKNIKIALFSFLVCAQAYAGAESHGGQVVVCPGKETVMLDYYQATLPTANGGVPQLIDTSKMSSQDMVGFLTARIQSNGQLGVQLDRAVELIGPMGTWLEGSLQTVSDSDPAYTLPPNCSLQQVAIRQDTTMYVDPAILQQLSPAQQGILFVHEALYYVASEDNNLDSSVEVRMVIRSLLLQNLDMVALSKAVHEMGSTLFWWEIFAGKTYSAMSGEGYEVGLSYDPLVDGDHMNYLMTSQTTMELQGTVECPPVDGNIGANQCRMVTGPGQCVLLNMIAEVKDGTDPNFTQEFVLSCTGAVIYQDMKANPVGN